MPFSDGAQTALRPAFIAEALLDMYATSSDGVVEKVKVDEFVAPMASKSRQADEWQAGAQQQASG